MNRIEELEERVTEKESQLQEKETELQELKLDYDDLNDIYFEISRNLESSQNKLEDSKEIIEQNEKELKEINDTINSKNKEIDQLKKDLEAKRKQEKLLASSNSKTESNAPTSNGEYTEKTMTATAYTAECAGCSGVTYTGIDLNKNRDKKVIAVDPNVIPLGSKVHVEGYGFAIAGDIGGAIKGNKIDLHVPTKKQAYAFGRQQVKVRIYN